MAYSQYQRAKEKLLKETGGRCFYCGIEITVKECQKEHFIPRSKGGSGRMSNMVASCYRCNMKKGNKDLEAFRKKLFGKYNCNDQKFYFEKLNISYGKRPCS